MEFCNKEVGAAGEEIAAEYLTRHGWEILFRNYRCKLGEIDMIARKKNLLCFIEVKCRRGERYGRPCEAVTKDKRRHIRRVAQYCIVRDDYRLGIDDDTDFRFDVIEVLGADGDSDICVIQNAF
ncbi:MAG: YraN family protein [Clostridiales Family XIII bacterium]|jgi:putative endonuclease|nr:YraN family protein [Clostridiales Family XIII bacterium]